MRAFYTEHTVMPNAFARHKSYGTGAMPYHAAMPYRIALTPLSVLGRPWMTVLLS